MQNVCHFCTFFTDISSPEFVIECQKRHKFKIHNLLGAFRIWFFCHLCQRYIFRTGQCIFLTVPLQFRVCNRPCSLTMSGLSSAVLSWRVMWWLQGKAALSPGRVTQPERQFSERLPSGFHSVLWHQHRACVVSSGFVNAMRSHTQSCSEKSLSCSGNGSKVWSWSRNDGRECVTNERLLILFFLSCLWVCLDWINLCSHKKKTKSQCERFHNGQQKTSLQKHAWSFHTMNVHADCVCKTAHDFRHFQLATRSIFSHPLCDEKLEVTESTPFMWRALFSTRCVLPHWTRKSEADPRICSGESNLESPNQKSHSGGPNSDLYTYISNSCGPLWQKLHNSENHFYGRNTSSRFFVCGFVFFFSSSIPWVLISRHTSGRNTPSGLCPANPVHNNRIHASIMYCADLVIYAVW